MVIWFVGINIFGPKLAIARLARGQTVRVDSHYFLWAF